MRMRIVHYMNQYFAGIGGEEEADSGVGVREGPVGPGVGLQAALGTEADVVASVYGGDGYMTTRGASGASEVVKVIEKFNPDVVVAGPSFGSGRYGLACGAVCVAVHDEMDVPTVAAMYEASPGAEQFRKDILIVPTTETVVGMRRALQEMARLALKLGRGDALGAPDDENYLPRGYRSNDFDEERGAARAIDMLLRKLRNEPFATEWPLPRYDRVAPPAAVTTSERVRLALVAEGGVVPRGNPDRVPSAWATKWQKYDVSHLISLSPEDFETVHGGFDTTLANQDPDRLIPLDAARELEQEGKIHLHNYLYSTVGNMGSITEMRRMGSEIAQELLAAGVQAVIVGAT